MQKTAIIIPCYNEAGRLNENAFLNFLSFHEHITFCFVNDGSTDYTAKILNSLLQKNNQQIHLVSLQKNAGKAEAVRQGMLYAHSLKRYDYVGFWDADLSTPLNELPVMLRLFEENETLVFILASRIKKLGSLIERRWYRHILGRVFATFSNFILEIPVYDSQCGAKIFRKEIVSVVFERAFITKWIFDVEILVRIRNHIGKKNASRMILEHPLGRWKDMKGSKLSFTDYCMIPFELMNIYFHYRR